MICHTLINIIYIIKIALFLIKHIEMHIWMDVIVTFVLFNIDYFLLTFFWFILLNLMRLRTVYGIGFWYGVKLILDDLGE